MPATAGLPTYALYGEPESGPVVEWLHCEAIAERSRRHDWEIQPHRHRQLLQILVLRRGRGEVLLEGRWSPLRGPCLVLVPPGVVHGFRFSPSVLGHVVTVAEAHARVMLGREPVLRARVFRAGLQGLAGPAAAAVVGAVQALAVEFAQPARWRALALDAALTALLLAVARHLGEGPAEPASASAPPPRALQHVERFAALVEQRFREQPPLASFASALAITPTQLNRVCRRVRGCPALQVLHARLLLEAQRELVFTTLSIKAIAIGLGFADAAYFTRFFQRHTGLTPSAWRARGV